MLRERQYRPMVSAPRDGTLVYLTWMDDGEPQEVFFMRWKSEATNDFFAPGVRGMWVAPDESLTWSEGDGSGPDGWAPEFDA